MSHGHVSLRAGRGNLPILWAVTAALLTISWAAGCASQPAPPPGVSPTGSLGGLEAKFIDVNGVETRYYEAGDGEPMVLVHGEGWSGHSSANTWVKNIPGLAKRFHVFAPDKLASGMTGNPLDDKDFNIQGEVEHMYQFIQTLKLGRVHLIGQSRGGGLAFFLSVAHPEVVKTLVIVDSGTASPRVGETDRQKVLASCPSEPDCEEWQCRLRAISFKPDEAFDDLFFQTGCYMAGLPKAQETLKKVAGGAGEPLRSQFNDWKTQVHERVMEEGTLQMPVLLYWGKNDPSAMLKNGLALYDVIAARNPNLRLFVSNHAGHFHYREYPEEWNQNVINFIDHWNQQPSAPAPATANAPAGGQAISKTGSVGGFEAKFVNVKGVRTRYYEAGDGEPMVLVHGEGFSGHSSANTWVKNLPGLAKRFRVFAVDKLAAGMTGNPPSDKDLNTQGEAEHIYQFIQTMNLGQVHLVGQSRGGAGVFVLAVTHPEVVKTLIIVNSGPAAPVVGETNRQKVLATCPKEPDCVEWECRLKVLSYKPDVAFDDLYFKTGCYMAGLPKAQATLRKMAAGGGEPLRSQFNEWKKQAHERVKAEGILQMPVLLYWGGNDPNSPPGYPRANEGLALMDVIGEKNPKVRMIIANHAGHFHYREYPEEWNRNVINFLDYWNPRPVAAGVTPPR
ncbi:MAG: alpha/beta hydrolase [Acidobacteriota bacterium]